MPKGQSEQKRVGWGEYVSPDYNDAARCLFLNAVLAYAPEVLDELCSIGGQLSPDDLEPCSACALAPLQAWATKWGLTDSWALETARATLKFHAAIPELRTYRQWPWMALGARWEPAEWPILITWDPLREREAAFRQRVDVYIGQIHMRAKGLGLLKSPEKREPEHVLWLVRYQVNDWTYEQILDEYRSPDTDISTVEKAVRETARLIGLTLRK
jgi:hypothetical protein